MSRVACLLTDSLSTHSLLTLHLLTALKAEVPVMDDPATRLNADLITTLQQHKQVVVCGEAKSHCVNFTLRGGRLTLVPSWWCHSPLYTTATLQLHYSYTTATLQRPPWPGAPGS